MGIPSDVCLPKYITGKIYSMTKILPVKYNENNISQINNISSNILEKIFFTSN